MFFFEKKAEPARREPKKFCSLSRTSDQRAPKEEKVFCFFFSKKKTFLPSYNGSPT
jgi:hypothetical protein